MPSPFSLTREEQLSMQEQYRLREVAETELWDVFTGGPARNVPDDVRKWVATIAPDPVFCRHDGLIAAGWDLLAVALTKVLNFSSKELLDMSSRCTRNPEAFNALLEHSSADDEVWLHALWDYAHKRPGRPAVLPSTDVQRAAVALLPMINGIYPQEYERLARRLAAGPEPIEVLTRLVADLGNPWGRLHEPAEVERLVDVALALSA